MSKQQKSKQKKSRTKPAKPSIGLTPEQFVVRGLETLIGKTKKGKPHKGFHTVWSGFKKAFETIYPDVDMIKLTKKMEEDGKIVIQPWKGGVLICPPGTKKIIIDNRVDDVLEKMGVNKR